MLAEVTEIVAPLRAALDAGDCRAAARAVHNVPTDVFKAANPGVVVEALRVAADALVEECDTHEARTQMHEGDVATWVGAALRAVHPRSAAARRLVKLVQVLSGSDDGRRRLGKAGVVDTLIRIWRRTDGAMAPEALCTLCSGSIENISRFMHRYGVCVAAGVITKAIAVEDENDEVRETLNASLLLLGLVCVCTPDVRTGGVQLIPLIHRAVTQVRGTALLHALAVVANVAEQWRKEGEGFDIFDGDELAATVCDAWGEVGKDQDMTGAAAWALTGLIRAEKVSIIPERLHTLLANVSDDMSAIRALQDAVAKHKPVRKSRKRKNLVSYYPEKRAKRAQDDDVGDVSKSKHVVVDNDELPSPTRIFDVSHEKPLRSSSRRKSPRLSSV